MNRADQAPEPSMEELLASIRLIISDANEKTPPPREAPPPRALTHEPAPQRESSAPPAGDDVFDLTDEFVFPEQQGGHAAAPPALRTEPKPALSARQEGGMMGGRGAHGAPVSAPPAVLRPVGERRAESFPAPRPDTQRHAAPPPSRPVWSRREMPAGPASYQPPAPRRRPDGAPPQKPQSRNWAEDIQMPVPEQGPVSLLPTGGAKPPAAPLKQAGESAGDKHQGQDADNAAPSRDAKQEAAAVAALAQRLARSAMGAMEASELKSAQKVDFEHLDAGSKADVTEKFADVMERESAALGTSALPTLLDEVFRQDFIREPEPQDEEEPQYEDALFEPAVEASVSPAPAAAAPQQEQEAAHAPEREAVAGPAAPPQPLEVQTVDAAVEAAAPEPAAAPVEHVAQTQVQPVAQAQPVAQVQPVAQTQMQPLAQVQFAGMVQPSIPAQAGRTLEDAVREMLRPLLVQWLNENMPRILENAIREEIALRGLLPKSDS